MSEAPTTDDGDDPLAALDSAVDSNAEPGSPEARLKEARKQIALALDDLDVDGDGRIPLVDGDETFGTITLYASDDTVQVVQTRDGGATSQSVEYRRSDALLFSACLRVLSLDT